VILAVLGVGALDNLTGGTQSRSTSPGIVERSQPASSGGSGTIGSNVSESPGSALTPGGSGNPPGSPSPDETPTTKSIAKPTAKPIAKPTPTPTPTPKPVTAIRLSAVLSGFSNPIFITGAHDGTDRLFVVEQSGHIRVVVNGRTRATDFLDISGLVAYGGEQGLLGLAFSPTFRSDGHFFVYYNMAGTGNIVVVRYTASRGTNVADAGSALRMITPIDHTAYTNHNGGMLAFGPNGLLYFGTGDGGGAGNPLNSAQNLSSKLGKILRINVNSATPVTPAVWAYGLRNPWRWSFDSATADMWIGDVGQDRYEEIDHVSRAQVLGSVKINFGWNIWEGRACYPSGTGCSARGVTMPVSVYAHGPADSIGCAVVGGYVYRGPVVRLRGNYFFGDYCSGRIWRLMAKSGNQSMVQVANTALNISSFGTDDVGNEYVVAQSGTIYKIGL
jgi:glucose/arabinose dehydrogenase